jgi:hypothetical protein
MMEENMAVRTHPDHGNHPDLAHTVMEQVVWEDQKMEEDNHEDQVAYLFSLEVER